MAVVAYGRRRSRKPLGGLAWKVANVDKRENFKQWTAQFKDWHPSNAERAAVWSAYLEGIRFAEAAQQKRALEGASAPMTGEDLLHKMDEAIARNEKSPRQ